jgi:hypothetical protein
MIPDSCTSSVDSRSIKRIKILYVNRNYHIGGADSDSQ